MTQAAHGTSARVATRRDPSARQAIVVACVAMTVIMLLDLMDGRLGLLYSVGFVLIVITVPLSVDVRALFPAGVFPPALLIVSLLAVCLFDASSIQVEGMAKDAGTVARLIAATIDHGLTLLIGHGIALGIIALRIITAPAR
jgi:TRAP-type C4-dicarboxylate transport system permease large subunit